MGDGVSDTFASVLKGHPDWNALPLDAPPAVRALIEGCLRKERRDRISDLSTATAGSSASAYQIRPGGPQIYFVLNWFEEVKVRVPTKEQE